MSSDGLLGTTAKNFAAQLGSFINNMGDGEAGGGDAGLGLKPEDCKFPMWVISVTDAIAVTSRASDLPCHEDLQSEGLLKKYDPGSMNKCLFLSHTWQQGEEQMRTVKLMLIEMMPEVKVFLGQLLSPFAPLGLCCHQ